MEAFAFHESGTDPPATFPLRFIHSIILTGTVNIYVGNLPYQMTEEELRQTFEEFGSVKSASILIDRETGRPRGFGFIEIDDEAGPRAIQELNGRQVQGRTLTVNEARPRAAGGGGGGGYSGGGGGGGGYSGGGSGFPAGGGGGGGGGFNSGPPPERRTFDQRRRGSGGGGPPGEEGGGRRKKNWDKDRDGGRGGGRGGDWDEE